MSSDEAFIRAEIFPAAAAAAAEAPPRIIRRGVPIVSTLSQLHLLYALLLYAWTRGQVLFLKTHTHHEKKEVPFLWRKKKKKLSGVENKNQFKIGHFRAKYRRSRTSCLGLFLLVQRQIPKG